MRAAAKRLHADPEFAAKNAERAAERMRKLNADPEFAAKNAERMRKLNADPEFAAKHAERMRKLNADPEFAAKNAERMRKRHADRHAAYGLRPGEETAWRALKARGFSPREAAGIVIRSRKAGERA